MFDKAREAGARRDYREAETLLTRIAAETDALPEALLYLGRARHALGDHERAIAAFSSYLEGSPDDGDGWFFLGRSYLAMDRLREAASCLRGALERGRDRPETWAALGLTELRRRRSGKSVTAFERALSLAPDDKRVFRAYLNALAVHAMRTLARGDGKEAAAMLGFVIDNGLDGLSQRLHRARALKAQGRYDEALVDLKAAIALEPGDPSLLLQAAALRFAIGDTQGAMEDIRRSGVSVPTRDGAPWSAEAIERYRVVLALKEGDPKAALAAALDRIRAGETDAAIRAVAAQANLELGRHERAAEHYRRAIEADPGAPDLRLGLALALWELGDYDKARSAARAAQARGARREDALYVEVLCDVRLGADPVTTLPKAQSLLRARPGDPRVMMALGECLYKTGRPDLADAWFGDVLRVTEDHELALLYRISVAESLGREAEALARYADYLAAYPDNAAIRRDYVNALVAARDWPSAVGAIEEGAAYGARGYEPILAAAYRNAGRYREAATLYRGLLRAEPKNPELLMALAYCLDKAGSKALAADLLERGAAYIAKQAEPYLALGVLRAREGASEKAVAAFLKASELAPADPRPLRNLARLYDKAGVHETAMRFEERAEALEPTARRNAGAKTS